MRSKIKSRFLYLTATITIALVSTGVMSGCSEDNPTTGELALLGLKKIDENYQEGQLEELIKTCLSKGVISCATPGNLCTWLSLSTGSNRVSGGFCLPDCRDIAIRTTSSNGVISPHHNTFCDALPYCVQTIDNISIVGTVKRSCRVGNYLSLIQDIEEQNDSFNLSEKDVFLRFIDENCNSVGADNCGKYPVCEVKEDQKCSLSNGIINKVKKLRSNNEKIKNKS